MVREPLPRPMTHNAKYRAQSALRNVRVVTAQSCFDSISILSLPERHEKTAGGCLFSYATSSTAEA